MQKKINVICNVPSTLIEIIKDDGKAHRKDFCGGMVNLKNVALGPLEWYSNQLR